MIKSIKPIAKRCFNDCSDAISRVTWWVRKRTLCNNFSGQRCWLHLNLIQISTYRFNTKRKKPTVTVVKKERKKIAAINLEEKFDDLH